MTRLNPASHGSAHIQRKTVETGNIFLPSTVTGPVGITITIEGKNKITFDWDIIIPQLEAGNNLIKRRL